MSESLSTRPESRFALVAGISGALAAAISVKAIFVSGSSTAGIGFVFVPCCRRRRFDQRSICGWRQHHRDRWRVVAWILIYVTSIGHDGRGMAVTIRWNLGSDAPESPVTMTCYV